MSVLIAETPAVSPEPDRRPRRQRRWLRRFAYVNRIRHRPAAQGLDRIHGFVEQLRAARLSPGHAGASAAYALLNWLLDAACLWLCFHAVSDAPIGATQVLLAFCAGMAAGSLTVIPGGLGVIDSAMVLGLVAGGVATPTAIAAVVLYRLISFGFIIGIGWITWLAIRQRQREGEANAVRAGRSSPGARVPTSTPRHSSWFSCSGSPRSSRTGQTRSPTAC